LPENIGRWARRWCLYHRHAVGSDGILNGSLRCFTDRAPEVLDERTRGDRFIIWTCRPTRRSGKFTPVRTVFAALHARRWRAQADGLQESFNNKHGPSGPVVFLQYKRKETRAEGGIRT
jgi:hypothetical protein